MCINHTLMPQNNLCGNIGSNLNVGTQRFLCERVQSNALAGGDKRSFGNPNNFNLRSRRRAPNGNTLVDCTRRVQSMSAGAIRHIPASEQEQTRAPLLFVSAVFPRAGGTKAEGLAVRDAIAPRRRTQKSEGPICCVSSLFTLGWARLIGPNDSRPAPGGRSIGRRPDE